MPTVNDPDGRRGAARNALERLYVLWMLGTLLTLFVMVVLVFIVNAQIGTQVGQIEEQNQRLARLERSVARLEASEAAGRPGRTESPPTDSPRTRPAREPGGSPATRPAPPTTRPAPGATRPVSDTRPKAMTDAELAARIEEMLDWNAGQPIELPGDDAAVRLLDDALGQADRADWHGRNWARLAILAQLCGRERDAERLLQYAADAGDTGAEYYDLLGRRALALNLPESALELALRWRKTAQYDSRAALLAAEAHVALDSYSEAHAAAKAIADIAQLHAADQLRLGRIYVALEDWGGLACVLDGLHPVDPGLEDERDLLRAIRLMRENRLSESLSVLDYLVDAQPDNYDVLVWRGAVLVQASQLEPAAEALGEAARLAPKRREAWYHMALLDLRGEKWDEARQHLNTAVTLSPRYVAAWEACGMVELNAGDPAAAIAPLGRAIAIHPERASAHFLLALAHAKLSQRDEAAAALEIALRLNPALLEQARQAEVLTRLIDPAEMERKVGGAAPGATDTAPSTSPAGEPATPPDRDDE